MCKVSVHGVFLCVHPGAKYLSRLGHISYKDEPSESMNLPWKYECDTLLQKHSAQKVPLPCPLHANNLKAKKNVTEQHVDFSGSGHPHHKCVPSIAMTIDLGSG